MPNERPSPMRLMMIGVPEEKRTRALVEAARMFEFERIDVVSWSQAFHGSCEPASGTIVRIESPSNCVETLRLILQAGIEPLIECGGFPIRFGDIQRSTIERGEIFHPRQWFLGFRELLRRLDTRWKGRDVHWMSSPQAIATTFDKIACLELWESRKLPTPERFDGISTYDALRSSLPYDHARSFIKLRYGYSAMGAVTVEWRGPLVRAITTVETIRSNGTERFFLSKKPQVIRCESEIARLIDRLGREEIVVEKWLPKDRIRGKQYDLRLITIGGRVKHVVGRASASPFTNLNLDAERISREELETRFEGSWTPLLTLTQNAAACIPEAGMLGIDVLVRPRKTEFALLEANAFGDYLPGLLHHGESTYAAQFRRLFEREANS